MTMSEDLYLAILSMDAYNRGYNPGIAGMSDANGVQIGNATILAASDSGPNSPEFAASFYAVSYTMGANSTTGIAEGTTIISYRGTDQPLREFIPVDLPISYGGSYDQRQIALAQQFFNSVQQNGSAPDIDPATMLLTGHSLGGGACGDHERLERSRFLDEVLTEEMAAMTTDARQVELSGPTGVQLRASAAQAIALVLHELATNAVKYGALARPDARLAVS